MDRPDRHIRLQKFLSNAGFCSRRKGEEYICKGMVSVNGRVVTQPGTKVDPDTDRVEVNGTHVVLETPDVYLMLNKPKGVISSCYHHGKKVVADLVDVPQRVYPVGRLDRDSTGLLLLTNDGRLHHRLSHPSFDHEKEYIVDVKTPISDAALKTMADGIELDGRRTRPAVVHRMGDRRFRIILKEGRNRQIRRMVKAVENEVTALHRIRIACVNLGRLPTGQWRYLSPSETAELLSFCGIR